MDAQLRISTFGNLTLTIEDEPVPPLVSRKAEALLIYLAANRRAYPREVLATMLWDDRPTGRSLGNLSVLLTSLRKHLAPYLIIDRTTLAINPESDVWFDAEQFEQQLLHVREQIEEESDLLTDQQAAQIEQALSLCQGAFLDGFHIRNGRGFDEWEAVERERLQRVEVNARRLLISHYHRAQNYRAGITHARQLLKLDPLLEETHRHLMLLYVRSGQRQQALAQFDAVRAVLNDELGVEPHPMTMQLYHRIRTAAAASIRLPVQTTPFIGRKKEVGEITSRLTQADCRLLTLLGSGGTGKTRLAIETATLTANSFLNGVTFVPLEGVGSTELLIPSIAAALEFTFFGGTSPRQQLLSYLEEKELLLLLDNFEHLLDGAPFLQEILQTAPHVTLLVTSRTRLKLNAEWIYEVDGLTLPSLDDAVLEKVDAVQFFARCAQRAKADFELSDANALDVAHVCHLLGGSPLALEMAASWVRILTPAEMLTEITHDLDFLEGSLLTTTQRHKSLRVVFEHSWQRLSEKERLLLGKLSLFPAGFTYDAARQIAGARLPTLASLVDNSLLQHDKEGRYRIHPLLRQYAREAVEDDAAVTMIGLEHSRYFGHMLAQQRENLRGPNSAASLTLLKHELDNIRHGWRYAIDHQDAANIGLYLPTGLLLYNALGWIEEGATLFVATSEMLDALPSQDEDTKHALIRALANAGKCYEMLSDSDQATAYYSRSHKLAIESNLRDAVAFAALGLGVSALMHSKYESARRHLDESLRDYRLSGNLRGAGNALNSLCQVARRQGDYVESRQFAEESLLLRRQIGDIRGVASTLNSLGLVMLAQDEFEEARRCLEESLALSREMSFPVSIANVLGSLAQAAFFLDEIDYAVALTEESLDIYRQIGDQWGVAIATNNLGYIAFEVGDLVEARHLYQDSLRIYRHVKNQWGIVNNLGNLGNVCLMLGNNRDAFRYFRESLEVAQTIDATHLVVKAIVGMGSLALKTGRFPLGLTLLTYTKQHESLSARERTLIQTDLDKLPPPADVTEVEAAIERGEQLTKQEDGLAQAIELARTITLQSIESDQNI